MTQAKFVIARLSAVTVFLGTIAVFAAPAVAQEALAQSPKAEAEPMPKTMPAEPMVVEDTASKAAAADLIGQCRAVNRQTPIFEARSTTSTAAGLLKMNDKVTLAENSGSVGLIAISKPTKGFIQMANLKNCPGQTPPPKPVGDCRVVTQIKGLSVRKEPGAGDVVGGVAQNDKVTLVMPIETKAATDGRDWVKIAKPVSGWVSEGFTGQNFRNLGACK
jgi:hypothetical protein